MASDVEGGTDVIFKFNFYVGYMQDFLSPSSQVLQARVEDRL